MKMIRSNSDIKKDLSKKNPVLFFDYSDMPVDNEAKYKITRINDCLDESTFVENQDVIRDLDEKQLTEFTMQVSEKSLEDVWEDEDDEYWESFL